jgi:hypothetical protein
MNEMYGDLEWIGKEVTVAYFYLSRHYSSVTRESYKNFSKGI